MGNGKTKTGIVGQLTLEQELFCQYYVKNDNSFGNGMRSYALAYKHDIEQREWETKEAHKHRIDDLMSNGSHLLRNEKVRKRIVEILNELMTDQEVDAQLFRVIKQDDKLEPKVAAIREYNKLRQRITDKQDITSGGKPLTVEISEVIAKKHNIIKPLQA
jgi:hypothetical protein